MIKIDKDIVVDICDWWASYHVMPWYSLCWLCVLISDCWLACGSERDFMNRYMIHVLLANRSVGNFPTGDLRVSSPSIDIEIDKDIVVDVCDWWVYIDYIYMMYVWSIEVYMVWCIEVYMYDPLKCVCMIIYVSTWMTVVRQYER